MNKLQLTLSSSFLALLSLVGFNVQATTTYDEADVITSTPVYRTVQIDTPRRECWEEEVARTSRRDRGDRSMTPNLLGIVIGGAIGNAVGHHSTNKKVGTVVGAVLGGSIAGDISRANRHDEEVVTMDTVERCRRVTDTREEEKLVGYDVRYRYNGSEHTVRMDDDPGETVRVRVNVEPVR
jgi:uncharacterized protein YcfJ